MINYQLALALAVGIAVSLVMGLCPLLCDCCIAVLAELSALELSLAELSALELSLACQGGGVFLSFHFENPALRYYDEHCESHGYTHLD